MSRLLNMPTALAFGAVFKRAAALVQPLGLDVLGAVQLALCSYFQLLPWRSKGTMQCL